MSVVVKGPVRDPAHFQAIWRLITATKESLEAVQDLRHAPLLEGRAVRRHEILLTNNDTIVAAIETRCAVYLVVFLADEDIGVLLPLWTATNGPVKAAAASDVRRPTKIRQDLLRFCLLVDGEHASDLILDIERLWLVSPLESHTTNTLLAKYLCWKDHGFGATNDNEKADVLRDHA